MCFGIQPKKRSTARGRQRGERTPTGGLIERNFVVEYQFQVLAIMSDSDKELER